MRINPPSGQKLVCLNLCSRGVEGRMERTQGLLLEKTRIQKESGTTTFIAALFTIARTWKQPRCPSTDEWIKKMWYIYTMEYYSAIKKNKTGSFVEMWMDLESVIRSEGTQRKTDIVY